MDVRCVVLTLRMFGSDLHRYFMRNRQIVADFCRKNVSPCLYLYRDQEFTGVLLEPLISSKYFPTRIYSAMFFSVLFSARNFTALIPNRCVHVPSGLPIISRVDSSLHPLLAGLFKNALAAA